jgi:hypothetical protein
MKIDKRKLAAIDLSGMAEAITDPASKAYFLMPEGEEHYKLLAYLSTCFDNILISDIGTYHGCSVLALSYNQANRVISFDVSRMSKLVNVPKNIELQIIAEDEFVSPDILSCGLIMLDTTHDGTHENQVIEYLIANNWKGVLILDDIHHFPEQNKLWESITQEKEDLTTAGHWSGTGIIYFK